MKKFNNKAANDAIKLALYDYEMNSSEKLTFIALIEAFDFSVGYSELSIVDIAKIINKKNRNSICEIYKRLEERGYIEVIREKGKTNRYKIIKYLKFEDKESNREINTIKINASETSNEIDTSYKDISKIDSKITIKHTSGKIDISDQFDTSETINEGDSNFGNNTSMKLDTSTSTYFNVTREIFLKIKYKIVCILLTKIQEVEFVTYFMYIIIFIISMYVNNKIKI